VGAYVLGVLSSMTAAGLGWLIYAVLWPRLVDSIYCGARVDGAWAIVETREGKEMEVGKIELIQHGTRVTGSGERRLTRDGQDSNRSFIYNGRFVGEQLTLIFQDKRGKDFDCGAYVFRLQNNGLELVGMATFHGKKENRVISESRVLRKKLS
jgi:hypothetical protein